MGSSKVLGLIFLSCIGVAWANLEGPFVFWGPAKLEEFRRPALRPLDQDELLDLYEGRPAIVVFDVQDASPRDAYPRLSRLLERTPHLVLPQDFLDVHPEYANNETRTIAVQGPASERDAEITEKFERLEDVYGRGNVLAVMGRSSSLDRDKREAGNDAAESDGRREAAEEVAYMVPGKALLYSADFPVLSGLAADAGNSSSGEPASADAFKLRTLIDASADDRGQFSRLILSFATDVGKVTLRFRFPTAAGAWSVGHVELVDPRGRETLLAPPRLDVHFGAPEGFSFACGGRLAFTNGSVALAFNELQVQPLLNGARRFGAAINCVDTMTIPIWSGLMVAGLLFGGVAIALHMIMEIKVMDRFENSKGKTLTISVNE